MTYDHELILINQSYSLDEMGNQIPGAEVETRVLCNVKSVSRAEFYNAAVSGLRPELIFVVHGYEYNGERIVKFEGVRYRVIRTYMANFEEVELTCEKVAANG